MDFIINYNRKNELKNKYDNNNILLIPDIFVNDFAELLFKYSLTEKNWVLACGIDKVRYENNIVATNKQKNDLLGIEVNKAYSQNHFSYIFHRTMNNKNPSLIEQNIRSALESYNFLTLLNNITGMNLTKLSTMFMSKYKPGHFLSPHSDKGNGRLAFVISLSKDWKPQYGGLLHFLNGDRTQVIDTVCPIFNNMVIFKVDDIEKPHYVSHVSPNVMFNRISISGWFE
jgi:Rps23 Pro-64 3,4-dihydroxylase Tpa1-like proline 4-hydroxylase